MATQAGSATKRTSRATTRAIEAGSRSVCTHCDQEMRFRTRERDMQVICNVYVAGLWDKVEHYHPGCYVDAGSPHGTIGDRSTTAGVLAGSAHR